MRDDEWRGHDLEAEDAGEGGGTEIVGDKRIVVTSTAQEACDEYDAERQ